MQCICKSRDTLKSQNSPSAKKCAASYPSKSWLATILDVEKEWDGKGEQTRERGS